MLPFFYHQSLTGEEDYLTLDEATSKHCIQVLRMGTGESLLLTNGKGLQLTATITLPERKRCQVKIEQVKQMPTRPFSFTLAISFTKNTGRNEWLLEKLTEMGCNHIIPVQTDRSEKNKYNENRWESILVAAMLQSQQCYLPKLHALTPFKKLIAETGSVQKLIAHCVQENDKHSLLSTLQKGSDVQILIGPEGDFTSQEIELAVSSGYHAVSLGSTRLRTETAGLYACTLFNALNDE